MTQIEFHAVEIESDIKIILQEISTYRSKTELNKKNEDKFDRWVVQLNSILDQISTSEQNIIPLISKDLGFPFKNKNLFFTAMLQPSLKNTFDEIKIHFRKEPESIISKKKLDELSACSDTGKSLAWIGDTVIKYALLLKIWQPGITPEELHNRRQSLETNVNLSILCDRWKLFEYRIHLDPPYPKQATIDKTKGTLVEAIYGVLYIEKEIDGVQEALPLIDATEYLK